MPAFVSTTVQKTLKDGVVTLFAEVESLGSNNFKLITEDGVSKGIKSWTRLGTGRYELALEPGIVVYRWLGSVDITFLYAPAGTSSQIRKVESRTVGNEAKIVIVNYSSGGTLQDFNLAGARLLFTLNFTTSPVY